MGPRTGNARDALERQAAVDGFPGDRRRRRSVAPVLLVVEVVSPESAHRDRTVKLRRYAEAGIPHYWCIEDEGEAPVVHVYELEGPTRSHAPAGIFRGSLRVSVPFEITLDLDQLASPGRR